LAVLRETDGECRRLTISESLAVVKIDILSGFGKVGEKRESSVNTGQYRPIAHKSEGIAASLDKVID
jgi:hypothetical protein